MFSVEPREDANRAVILSPPCRVGWVFFFFFFFCTPHSQRGALCSWAQLLAHNSSFYVPLFLPVSMVVSPKKGKWLPFCQQAMCWLCGGWGGRRGCVVKTCYFFPKYRVLMAYQLSVNTHVSLHCALHHCLLPLVSARSRVHFYQRNTMDPKMPRSDSSW